jgi:biotin carboxylase
MGGQGMKIVINKQELEEACCQFVKTIQEQIAFRPLS